MDFSDAADTYLIVREFLQSFFSISPCPIRFANLANALDCAIDLWWLFCMLNREQRSNERAFSPFASNAKNKQVCSERTNMQQPVSPFRGVLTLLAACTMLDFAESIFFSMLCLCFSRNVFPAQIPRMRETFSLFASSETEMRSNLACEVFPSQLARVLANCSLPGEGETGRERGESVFAPKH